MIPHEIRRMYDILVSFLGQSKSELDESLQLQFSCPKCQERDGFQERNKYHLEVNIEMGLFHCWKCSSIDERMQGSIYKLIRKYGNQELLKQYKDAVDEFKKSSFYKIHFNEDSFGKDYEDLKVEEIKIPVNYKTFKKESSENTKPFKYLQKRGIDWTIIEDFHIGYTEYDDNDRKGSNRIILPSFDKYGQLNYWTGRDYTGNEKRQRYDNPKVDRKDIIFNEEKVLWNADITLVEGPFDSIVVPNSIPLLGKQLNEGYKLYNELFNNANANINIFLDGDAIETSKKLYKTLNNGRLQGKIRFIYVPITDEDLDPSKIFQLYGRKGIIQYINSAKRINLL